MSTPQDQSIIAPVANEETPAFSEFMQAVVAGNIEEMRLQVAAGFDMATADRFGASILEAAISDLEFLPEIAKYEVVKELLRLGANPCQRNGDGFGPLFAAVLNMDTEMLRILLDAGADPNAEQMESATESLYDWAEFDYRYEVWNINNYGDATEQDYRDEDVWLNFLEARALAEGKRGPDHLKLLRAKGGLSMSELSDLPEGPHSGAMDKYRHRFEVRVDTEAKVGKADVDIPQYVSTVILVNGDQVEAIQAVDVPVMLQSLVDPGRYEIFTCQCGVPRNCGAVFHGVEVRHRHKGKLIGWEMKHPQYVYSEDAPYDGSDGPEGTSTYWFTRSQMLSALRSYFCDLQRIFESANGNIDWDVHGQSAMEVLKLASTMEILAREEI
jgi:hypothetical protein